MPEVIAPVEEVGALVVTLAGSGLQIKRAGGALQTVLNWNEADGSLFLSPGSGGGGVVVQGPALQINGFATVVGSLSVGTNPASTGWLRIANNAVITARNAANSGDVGLIWARTDDKVGIDANGNGTTFGGIITAAGGHITVTGGANPYLDLDDGSGASYIQVVAGSINLSPRNATTTVTGALNVTGNISSGSLIVNAAGTAIAQINSTTGAITDTQQLHFTRNGLTQWRIGNNITATNIDLFELYNEGVGTAFAVNKSDRMVTFYGGISIQGGPFSAGTITKNSIYGMLNSGSTGTQYDWAVVTPTGGNIILVTTGTANVEFSGNVALVKNLQGTLTIQSTLSNDSYLQFLGTATVKNWRLGKDISTGNGFDIQASVTNGGVDFASIFILTSAGNLTLSGSLAAQNIVTVNRGSAASLLGYYGVFRLGNPIYYFGTNGADSGCILNAAATLDIISWTNAGDLTLAGTFNANGPSGFGIGSVANRRRIQSTGVNSFSFLGDANGFADVAMLTLLLTPAGVAAPVDCQLWTNGASVFIRLGGVTKTFTLT